MHKHINEEELGYKWVFCRFIRRKDGTIIRPKTGKVLRFKVKV